MGKILRIGTRDSKLALWQAEEVLIALKEQKVEAELVPVKSPGDIDLSTPLHLFGNTGIFTKVLDDALLRNDIDIAVHSLKDYPTEAPQHLEIAAVLKRGPFEDVLVHKGDLSFLKNNTPATIATGSIRRVAQWKNHFPHHQTTGLRGNVQTRLKKLEDNNWQGAIFAKAGLERLGLLSRHHLIIEEMIPAPAQGIIGIGCRTADQNIKNLLAKINHQPTFLRARLERQFMRTLEGGCSAPIGALTQLHGNTLYFKGGVFAPDGSDKVIFESEIAVKNADDFGTKAAREVLAKGGSEIMQIIRNA